MSSGGSTAASTFAPTKAPSRTALIRPHDHASSMATATGLSRVPRSDAAEAAQQTPMSREGWGSLASDGTGKRDKQAVRVKNALGALLEETKHEIGSSYEATTWRKLEDGPRKASAGAMYKFLRYHRVDGLLSLCEALNGRMLHVAQDGQYESPVKALPRLPIT